MHFTFFLVRLNLSLVPFRKSKESLEQQNMMEFFIFVPNRKIHVITSLHERASLIFITSREFTQGDGRDGKIQKALPIRVEHWYSECFCLISL